MTVEGHEQRPQLSADEQRLFAAGGRSIRLEDRSVERLIVSSCSFADAHLKDVVFRDCRFTNVLFDDARFENVRFEACELIDVDFRAAAVNDSSADATTMAATRFIACRLSDTTLATSTLKDAVLESSVFDRVHITAGLFVQTRIERTRFEQCQLTETRFARPVVAGLEVVGGTMSSVLLSAAQARGIHLVVTSIDGLNIVLGNYAGLTFEGVSGQTLRMTDAEIQGLSLLHGASFSDVSVSGGNITGLAIARWEALSMFMIGHARVTNLFIEAASITGLYARKSKLTATTIWSAGLAGVDLEESTLDELALAGVQFSTLLRVPKARITGLSMQGVVFQDALEIHDEGVFYGRGDRFPSSSG